MYKRDSGVISLLTAIMVSILVITMAMGLLILTTGGTQQASDDELSLRAYAAANGAVEWAYWNSIVNGAGSMTACDPASLSFLNNPANGTDNAITCLKTTTNVNSLTGYLEANNAKQVVFDSAGVPPPNMIEVSWLDPNLDANVTGGYSYYDPVLGALPPSGPSALPGIELTIVNFQTNLDPGFFGAGNPNNGLGNIHISNVVLLPGTSNSKSSANWAKKIIVGCTPGGAPYQCVSTANDVWVGLTNGAGNLVGGESAIIYIRAIYPDSYAGPRHGAHFSLRLLRTNGNPVTMPTQSTTIDVTARSGPVYRRIEATATKDIGSVPSGLNYVLFGDRHVCKDFNITEPPVGLSDTNPNGAPCAP